MIQLKGFDILDLIDLQGVAYKIATKSKDLSNKVSLDYGIKIGDVSRKILPDPKKF